MGARWQMAGSWRALAALVALLLLTEPLLAHRPPHECEAGCEKGSCCCMYCGANGTTGPHFTCVLETACMARGGQCKTPETTAYARPPPAPRGPRQHRSGAPDEVEQVRLIGVMPTEVAVVFAAHAPAPSTVELREAGQGDVTVVQGHAAAYSSLVFPTGDDQYDHQNPHPGAAFKHCGPIAYSDHRCYYTSAPIHTVTLKGLTPGTLYEYRPAASGRWRSFRTPPKLGSPIAFGVLADVGQTADSARTLGHLRDALRGGELDAVLLPGDLAYADGYPPAWDAWGRLSEPLFEAVPAAFGVGNHEVANGVENFANFVPRYGWPDAMGSSSGSRTWFSFEAGLAHVVMLCSYCDYAKGSLQYQWLAQDLASVSRDRTPWLVALWHTPWYISAVHHTMSESAAMRDAMEELLYEHKVDVVLSGHLHAYERTAPVYKGSLSCDGPVYITIGDGGNHEGPACPWNKTVPAWTMRREFSFGHGLLTLHNSTHGLWQWRRNQDGQAVSADSAQLRTAASRCPVASRGAPLSEVVV